MAGERTFVHPLSEDVARQAGRLCGQTGTSDVIDASVAVVAREIDGVVLTSKPEDIRRLAPDLRIATV